MGIIIPLVTTSDQCGTTIDFKRFEDSGRYLRGINNFSGTKRF